MIPEKEKNQRGKEVNAGMRECCLPSLQLAASSSSSGFVCVYTWRWQLAGGCTFRHVHSSLFSPSIRHTQNPAQSLKPASVCPEENSFSVSTSPGKVTSCCYSQFQDTDFRARLLSHVLSVLSWCGHVGEHFQPTHLLCSREHQ